MELLEQECVKCKIVKSVTEFKVSIRFKTGFTRVCEECKRQRKKKYSISYGILNKEKLALYNKNYAPNWYLKNKEKVLKQTSEYYYANKHKVKVIERVKNWQTKNKTSIDEKRRLREQLRRKLDAGFRIKQNLSRNLRTALEKNGTKKINKILDLIDCSISQLKKHLESKFYPDKKTGEMMTWSNYGQFGWHIDHIIPVSQFNIPDLEAQKQCFHWTNLQPLWWWENINKRDNPCWIKDKGYLNMKNIPILYSHPELDNAIEAHIKFHDDETYYKLVNYLVEEMCELTKELMKESRNRKVQEEISNEFADVLILMEFLARYKGYTKEDIMERVKTKALKMQKNFREGKG